MDSWGHLVLALIHGIGAFAAAAAHTSDKPEVANVVQEQVQKDEGAKPTECILCGASLRPARRGLYAELFTGTSIHCASGHGRLDWMGGNRWFTRDDDAGQRLMAKGFRVLSAPPVGWFGTRYFIGGEEEEFLPGMETDGAEKRTSNIQHPTSKKHIL